ncbi:hypothetical protein [Chryseobacterium indoltheticum]|uniref:hypothetical protein n=1 Tax=Chryseobacterium indoltheticum TaxID=254 RepID=UPI001911A2CF|nr:hypothetical protein [Chryseobacterium indoltheticum]QQQ27070.1 hypothetical protein JJL46_13175 [Chryseobacterium indoltheticum]
MKRIFIILTVFLLLIGCKKDQSKTEVNSNVIKNKNRKDYIDFKYDKAIAFASVNPMDYFDGNFDKELDVKKFKDTINRNLDLNQIKDLNDILSGKKNGDLSDSAISADCFYPRHNIIFLKDEKIVNYISVCFECNQIKSSKPTFAKMQNFVDFFNSINLKMFPNPIEHKEYYDSLKFINNKH